MHTNPQTHLDQKNSSGDSSVLSIEDELNEIVSKISSTPEVDT
jgi:hypothetical protein